MALLGSCVTICQVQEAHPFHKSISEAEPLPSGLWPWRCPQLARSSCSNLGSVGFPTDVRSPSHLVLRNQSVKRNTLSKPGSLQIIPKWKGGTKAAVPLSRSPPTPDPLPHHAPLPVNQSSCCLDDLQFSASWVCLIRNRPGSAPGHWHITCLSEKETG